MSRHNQENRGPESYREPASVPMTERTPPEEMSVYSPSSNTALH